MLKNRIIVFDTTLRDGEQAPGAALTSQQKLEVAYQLEKLGVDVIEAGFPIASPDDFKGVSLVASSIKKSMVCGLARCLKPDIEAVRGSLKKAKRPRIHVFLATSKIHLQYKFKKPENEILELAVNALRLAGKYFDDVEFSPEDATRTDRNFLYRVVEAAIKNGAKTINIPDTVGYSYPQEMYDLISGIRNNVPNINKAVIAVHCHDDLGLATANTLSAVMAGARQVHCTVNGIGERAGNASLEEVIMALKVRRDGLGDYTMRIKTEEIYKTSHLVSTLTGFSIPYNKAVVGKNAFRHESGIHQDAIIKQRDTYEIMDPKDIGVGETELVLGKHSGKHALKKRLKELGVILEDEKLAGVFKEFKELADKKKEIFDDDLIALAQERLKDYKKGYELISIKIVAGTDIVPVANVKVKDGKKILENESTGDGPVDACYRAIDKITRLTPKLVSYKLNAVTRGKDAQGMARVEIRVKNERFSGLGTSTDILEASVKAYLDAINRVKA
ncbi:MAG: 2-isopropylmalate synthase [Candidatus Omnitrophica bacterium]|nr:2-isopropylmalate synthase [Candidatus Omnitrophota bacterium]MDD5080913.1 2-isopropylmalate synthase [Candidatus Omnitrophota bacterium]